MNGFDRGWRAAVVGAALAGLALAAGLGGCTTVGYVNWPPVAGDTASNNPEAPPADEVQIAALKWLVERHPPTDYEGPIAVNLPTGVRAKAYRRIVGHAGPNAVPLTPETEHLPTYHVEAFRIRGDAAEIDLLRPAVEVPPGADGKPVYQRFTLYMKSGGPRGWFVDHRREWTIGETETPPPHYYTEPPEPPEPRIPANLGR